MKILVITSEWPSSSHPEQVPFLINEINELRKFGMNIDVFSFSGKKKPLIYLKEWFRLHFTFDLEKYDLLHAEWGQSGLLVLPKQKPLVVTFRGSDLEGIINEKGKYTFSGIILRLVSQFIAIIADHVVIVSESILRYLPPVSYTVLPVCLDTNIFKPMPKEDARKQLNLPLDKHLILFASNPNRPEKRYALAKAAVEMLGDNTQLIVTRNVQHKQMMLYYNACDALVITSSHEGSPTVMYEALACNLPIVSTDVGDVKYRIEEIDGCYVCKGETIEEIASYLLKSINSGKRIAGYNFVSKFDTEHFCMKMNKVYESCLKK